MTDKREFEITQDRVRALLIYNPETGLFCWKRSVGRCVKKGQWIEGSKHSGGYLRIRVDGQLHYAHRLAWMYMTGRWPINDIDHCNGDRTDNRFCNLREATRSENLRNKGMRSVNSSGYKGVSFDKRRGKWRSTLVVNRKQIHIGYFESAERAHQAYCQQAKKLHGDFARTA